MSEQVDWKAFLTRRWRAHRAAFRVGSFEHTGGVSGFICVDKTQHPPVFHAALLDPTAGLRMLQGDLTNDNAGAGDLAAIAKAAFRGETSSTVVPFAEAMRMLGLVGEGCPLAERSLDTFTGAIEDPVVTARMPRSQLIAQEIQRFDQAGIAGLRAALAPGGRAALSASETFRWRDYQFYAKEDERTEARQQAAQTYPLLATLIVERPSLRMAVDGRRSLGEALQLAFGRKVGDQQIVDALFELQEGVPLAAIAAKSGIPEKTVEGWAARFWKMDAETISVLRDRDTETAQEAAKALETARREGRPITPAMKAEAEMPDDLKPLLSKGLSGRLVKLTWPTNGIPVDKIIQSLAQLPPDWFPRNREDWDAFCDLTATVGTPLRIATGLSLESLYQGCGGKWADFRLRCAIACSDTRAPEAVDREMEERLRAAMPMKDLANLPRDKIHAAAMMVVSELQFVPEGLDAEAIAHLPASHAIPHGVGREEIVDWLKRLYAPIETRHALKCACIVAEDVISLFARKVVLPLAANATAEKDVYLSFIQHQEAIMASARILFSGKSALAVFEAARHANSRSAEIFAGGCASVDETNAQQDDAILTSLGLPAVPSDTAWPALFDPVQAPNGCWLACLTESHLLREEGFPGYQNQGNRANPDGTLGLRHCVGTYGYDEYCRTRGDHIISIRTVNPDPTGPKFERISTFQLGRVTKGDTNLNPLVRQNLGLGNGAPGPISIRALAWFLESVSAGSIPLNHAAIRESQTKVRKKVDDVEGACGYNWRDRNCLYAAMKPWAKYVAKKYRQMGVDEFSRTPDVLSVARQIDPGSATPQTAPLRR